MVKQIDRSERNTCFVDLVISGAHKTFYGLLVILTAKYIVASISGKGGG